MASLRTHIHNRIVAAADQKTQAKLARLVPGARAAGTPVPKLRALVAEFRRQQRDLSLEGACDLMDDLCQDRLREELLFGIFLLGGFGRQIASIPWRRLRPWINALDNWETCDQLASNVSGAVVAANLALMDQVVALTASANPWQRRFALATVSELNHKGRSHPEEALRVCQLLLADPEPTVRKAVGWALKEASKKAESQVYEFLSQHRGHMAASVLREAAEKLSPAHRQRLLG
jgi:3-methyladenine DNA glycosylase AlkD